ncbi:MAG TPA: DUF1330 domain-containing protein [Dongiaceae bacterium]|jgi:uncharacterized protein (DUF1330 family)|nr:DUF1330 domain-containing protein [Dongiaceae bacterium]
MAAYLIIDLTVKDAEALKEYGSRTPDILKVFGGKTVAKGPVQVLHGDSKFDTKVVFEFPDREAAVGWYNSKEYQALLELRDRAIDSQFHLIG